MVMEKKTKKTYEAFSYKHYRRFKPLIYKHYRRFKPLLRKEKNLMRIHKWLFWFIIIGCLIGFLSVFIELPKIFLNCLNVSLTLSMLGLFYLIYLKLKLKKEIDKVVEEIKEEQKSQFN